MLKRLTVSSEESFYGLQSANVAANFEQDPPIFACRFADASGYEHILALANEDGRVAIQVLLFLILHISYKYVSLIICFYTLI